MNANDVSPTTEATANGRDARSTPDAEPQAGRLFNSETGDSGQAISSTGEITSPAPLSVNKVAANRRNARRSTGPLTLRGKEASRMNAVRHGILSSAVVVRG